MTSQKDKHGNCSTRCYFGNGDGNTPIGTFLGDKRKSGAVFCLYAFFVATNKAYNLGDEIYLILSLLDDPNKYPVAGKVVWSTPAGAGNNKAQGIGVHFPEDESGLRIKQRVEELLGAALRSSRITHTL